MKFNQSLILFLALVLGFEKVQAQEECILCSSPDVGFINPDETIYTRVGDATCQEIYENTDEIPMEDCHIIRNYVLESCFCDVATTSTDETDTELSTADRLDALREISQETAPDRTDETDTELSTADQLDALREIRQETAPELQVVEFDGTVADLVSSDDDLQALEDALVAVGLVDVLQGPGPFTLFAPTSLDSVDTKYLRSDWVSHLTDILLYHVAASNVTYSDLVLHTTLPTLNGEGVDVTSPDPVQVNNADVTSADNFASNGVVHKINDALLPPWYTISLVGLMEIETYHLDEIGGNSDDHGDDHGDDGHDHGDHDHDNRKLEGHGDEHLHFSTLLNLLESADLYDLLDSNVGPFTLLAPVDEAFQQLDEGVLASLQDNIDDLINVLSYHVLPGIYLSSDLTEGLQVTALNGEKVTISHFDKAEPVTGVTVSSEEYGIAVNDWAAITHEDGYASNGVIHAVDFVLIPSDLDVAETGGDETTEDDETEVDTDNEETGEDTDNEEIGDETDNEETGDDTHNEGTGDDTDNEETGEDTDNEGTGDDTEPDSSARFNANTCTTSTLVLISFVCFFFL